MKLLWLWKICCCFYLVNGEEYNLFGSAGQAYSLDINIGQPKQKLRLIVDTGSTTMAIASYAHHENNVYFHTENSTTLVDTEKLIHAQYSQGDWVGHYVTDIVEFPTLNNVPTIRSDLALIQMSRKFFWEKSGWQGLLGLAYYPIGAWGGDVVIGSWLDSLEKYLGRSVSFELKLCGVLSTTNDTHYGKFSMIVDEKLSNHTSPFRTPILQKRWYEVGILGFNVKSSNTTLNDSNLFDYDTCQKLNEQKSIVDSGTTDIRLPHDTHKQLVDQIRQESEALDKVILKEFWYNGEAACWPEPQGWIELLPPVEIHLLSDVADNQYFTLEIPPQNYIRVVAARNSSGGAVAQFCYKLALAACADTVLGYTAMEGFKVVFNRTGSWIGFEPSNCGPKARVSGPYSLTRSFIDECKITRAGSQVAVSIQAAQWALCAISIIAAMVLIYLLAPTINMYILRWRQKTTHSLSQDALVEQELS